MKRAVLATLISALATANRAAKLSLICDERNRHAIGHWKLPFVMLLIPLSVRAQHLSGKIISNTSCAGLTESIDKGIVSGRVDEAERAAFAALSGQTGPMKASCAAVVLGNVSAAMQASGRLSEAWKLASKALAYFDANSSPDNAARLAPLYVLASVQIEQGMTGGARETYRKMQRISAETPHQRSWLYGIGAALDEIAGRWDEAEFNYKHAVEALAAAGRGHSAEIASVLAGLATVYLNEAQYAQALAVVDEGLKILETATDAVALDRIKLLNLRGVIMGRQRRWREAEQDLSEAFSLARQQSQAEPIELAGLAENYAAILRKVHRKRDAKSIAAWAATFRDSASKPNQVVDVTELVRSPDR